MSLLQTIDLHVRFGGVKAVDGVSFSVQPGEIFSIIGPNGAGKTTIFNLISHIYAPDQGRILFEGQDITRRPAHDVAGLGIARTFQNLQLFTGTTVLANVLLGFQSQRRTGVLSDLLFTPGARRQEAEFRSRGDEILRLLDLRAYRDAEVGALAYGVRKRVETARALAASPKLLLLDEPSSGLSDPETHVMVDTILMVRKTFKTAIVMVEHDMTLVNATSDRVLTLVAGRVLAEGTPEEIAANESVRTAYLGAA